MTPFPFRARAPLLLRAINWARMQSDFGYLPLRLFAEQLPLGGSTLDFAEELNAVRSATSRASHYVPYRSYKGRDEAGEHTYRQCHAAAPLAALSEAGALALLSAKKAFRTHKRVYSYRAPRSGASGHNFQYYLDGFVERQGAILAAIERHPAYNLLVVDASSFYPSIDQRNALYRMEELLNGSFLSRSDRRLVEHALEWLFSSTGSGLPTGSALAHRVADIFMRPHDERFSSLYRRRYFRYVDDIALLVPSEEVDSALATLGAVLQEDGLSINEEKTEVIGPEQARLAFSPSPSGTPDEFQELLSTLRVVCSVFPDFAAQLRKLNRDEETALPVSDIVATAKYSHFRWALFRGRVDVRWARRIMSGHKPSVAKVSHWLSELRQAGAAELNAALEARPVGHRITRQRRVRRQRRLLNTLLYIERPDALAGRATELAENLEHREWCAVVRAVQHSDPWPITFFPGGTARALSQLWLARGLRTHKIDAAHCAEMSTPQLDATFQLVASGILSVEGDLAHAASTLGREMVERIRFAMSDSPSVDALPDTPQYLRELRALQMAGPALSSLRGTRFSEGEAPVFDALDIGLSELELSG